MHPNLFVSYWRSTCKFVILSQSIHREISISRDSSVATDIFIGVDGGGTKCKVRVEDHHGILLSHGEGGPANIRLSVAQSWASIYQALNNALDKLKINLQDSRYRFHVGMGLAGCEVTEAYDEFLAHAHSFATVQLTTDAHVACLGAHHGKDGAVIIVGTGVVAYQIQNGVSSKVGGWGFPHDDEGGGAWLGMEACRLTCQWLDKRIDESKLAQDTFAYFNDDVESFLLWTNRANSSEFAKLAPLVINHSQTAEPYAVALIQRAAFAVDQMAVALGKMQITGTQPLPICLFGGVAPFVEPWLSPSLHEHLIARESDANVGAILMIRQVLGQQNL
jgi:glucosamine kinase